MSKKEKLLERAIRNPAGLKFEELCAIYEQHGFTRRQGKGSHVVFSHPRYHRAIPIQNRNGMAKEEQVRYCLKILEELDLI